MTALQDALEKLRSQAPAAEQAGLTSLAEEITASGVGFAAVGGRFEQRWVQALSELQQCVKPLGEHSRLDGVTAPAQVLNEGGPYYGTWLESTGTINTEMLARFAPDTATRTFSLFAAHQRQDGLIPYKVTDAGPGFSQIQLVTPPARSVWTHHRLGGGDREWLRRMYESLIRYDRWLAQHRDTRGSGAVEAFCTFDTGHDLSPRFWFTPDRCRDGEASRADPEAPGVPYIAPDLTAAVACQREHLGRIAAELGEDPAPWRQRRESSVHALFEQCYDPEDAFFYDRDAFGAPVRVQSDVLLRVVAAEVGDEDLFETVLRRHLMHTGKFLAHYGFTSIALDDPRFDADHTRNSWAGPVNFLSLLRAPHAFEHRGRTAELAVASRPVFAALAAGETFPQCMDPFSGDAGYTSVYSPSILWYLDAVERYSGILPVPGARRSWTDHNGEPGLWFTSLAPTRLGSGHGQDAQAVAYARTVRGIRYELAADDEQTLTARDGEEHLRFPRGWRVETDGDGEPTAVVGVLPRPTAGTLHHAGRSLPLTLGPNERVELTEMRETGRRSPGFVPPQHG